jgi:hypothetical protein
VSEQEEVTEAAWWLRLIPGIELWPLDPPILRLTQGGQLLEVDLAHVKALIAGLTGAAADLAGVMRSALARGNIAPDDDGSTPWDAQRISETCPHGEDPGMCAECADGCAAHIDELYPDPDPDVHCALDERVEVPGPGPGWGKW